MLASFSGASIAFQGDVLLENVSFRIDRRERVALVGRNGTGKTTLLKMLTGELEPDSGSVNVAPEAKIGYLRQQPPADQGRSVLEEAQTARQAHLEMRQRITRLEEELASDKSPEALEEYALLQERLAEAGAYADDQQIENVLRRMGFEESEFSRPVSLLSGGERTRLALAVLLLEEPDLLVLDEPTNHLDMEAAEFLEKWLCQFHGSVLLVSHDRTFLDATAERVLELESKTVKAYPGPFPKYIELRAEWRARQAEVARKQQIEIDKLDEYVRRFMNSQRTAQARGRLKMMNRLIANKVSAPKEAKGIKGALGTSSRSGNIVIESDCLTFGYEDLPLGKELNWTVRSQERWGIVGDNGTGKSTLAKTILGRLDPLAGSIRLGSGVLFGFFTQDSADFDPEMSPLDLLVWENDLSPAESRNVLGQFLITGDDVFRPIKTLSGGEKNKLALAQLTVLKPNLLLLDEPTNHLDMDSREALAEILKGYQGTLVLVSHDRWLLGEVTDHILDLKKDRIVQYPGGWLDYRRRQNEAAAPQQARKKASKQKPVQAALTPRELSKEIERAKKELADAEDRVAALEAELASIESELAAAGPQSDILALTTGYARVKEQIEGSLAVWESLASNVSELEAMQGAASLKL